jgi:anti-sigma factor RsiW
MTEEQQIQLQAFLDGELPEPEACAVSAWLARDAEATAILAELRNTRSALAGFEAGIKLPESREFYWSKIEREIRRLEQPASARPAVSPWTAWRKFLVPASLAAALILMAVVAGVQFRFPGQPRLPELETAMADSGAFTYRDYSAGVTLVWFSYPAENELAETDEAETL